MTFAASIDGSKRLRRKLENLPKQYRHEIKAVLNKTLIAIKDEARISIKAFSGAYRWYNIKGGHWSSPPGKPPNEITGNLRMSIKASDKAKIAKLEGSVEVGAPYGIFLELGTRYMEARPFLGPAFRKHSPSFTKAGRQIIRRINRSVSNG